MTSRGTTSSASRRETRAIRRGLGCVGLVLTQVVAACSSEPGPVPLLWLGSPGQKAPASTAGSIFWVDPTIEGRSGSQLIVDTGAPVSILNPHAFLSGVREGSTFVSTLTIGGVTLWKTPIIGLPKERTYTPNGAVYGGILGFTAFGQFSTSFNYRDRCVVFGTGSLPDELEPPTAVGFALAGGGFTTAPEESGQHWVAAFPASRVIVSAQIEGQPYRLLVDTGASWIGLDSSWFSTIASDGRVTISDDATLETGATTASVTRLHSMSVAGVEVPKLAAVSGSGIDQLLTTISQEVGERVDGMLGAPFLRQFYVTLDYPRRELLLRRYMTQDHILDEYQRVGIELHASLNGSTYSYWVSRVFADSDAAAQHVTVGEQVLQVEGQDVSSLPPSAVNRLLLGSEGSTKRIQLEGRALGIRVDNLLPLLP